MSIRSKVTAAFALCISLPMVAGMGALWLGTENTLRHQASQDLQASTRSVMATIEEQMAFNFTHLKAWSSLPVMQDVLIGDDGGELLHTLNDLNLNYPDFGALTITNAQGAVVATTDPAQRHSDLSAYEGVHAAVSGRRYQSNYTIHRAGGIETFSFTVPLVAAYDRQTVIGTLTGYLDLQAMVERVVGTSTLGIERRTLVLAQHDKGSIIFSSRSNGALLEELKRVDPSSKRSSYEFVLGSEPHLATFVRSKGTSLEKNPGLIAFGIAPSATVFAAVDNVSNIFIAVAGFASVIALVIAWRWSTPLVRLASRMGRVARGEADSPVPKLHSHNTFAPLAIALDTMRETTLIRDRLAAREVELIHAKSAAEAEASAKSQQFESLSTSLRDQITSIVDLCNLITKENVAAASNTRHVSYARELSRSGTRLLAIVEDAISNIPGEAHAELETVIAQPVATQTAA